MNIYISFNTVLKDLSVRSKMYFCLWITNIGHYKTKMAKVDEGMVTISTNLVILTFPPVISQVELLH